MVKLIDNSGIHPKLLKDGEIAIITKWTGQYDYIGRIVQRFNNILITIGAGCGCSWNISELTDSEVLKVRVLQRGEMIVIE